MVPDIPIEFKPLMACRGRLTEAVLAETMLLSVLEMTEIVVWWGQL